MNDDNPMTTTTDSALSFQVAGATGGAAVTFYVHVFDWRGDARPDMKYQIIISGVN
jgi:predicted enzyme related to lactoylglutathione lyase